MIRVIGCSGYRSFVEETQFSLKRLTILFGKNNSGKTTLTRLPLFIAAAAATGNGYVLDQDGLRFGSSFRDLANAQLPFPALSYWVEADGSEPWRVDMQLVTQELEDRVLLKADATPAPKQSALNGESLNLPPRVTPPTAIAQQLMNIIHIPSARPSVKPIYELRQPVTASIDEVPYWLASHPDLLIEVSTWMTDFAGVGIDVEKEAFGFRLVTDDGSQRVNMSSAGRGVQAALPVATLILGARAKIIEASLVIVEEPEAHLHPSAHASLAELLADAASPHCQVLAETHSENLILRLRRKVASNSFAREDLSLNFVDENQLVLPLEVDEYGGVRDWPVGVFETDIEEASAIVEARLAAMSGGKLEPPAQ